MIEEGLEMLPAWFGRQHYQEACSKTVWSSEVQVNYKQLFCHIGEKNVIEYLTYMKFYLELQYSGFNVVHCKHTCEKGRNEQCWGEGLAS